MANVMLRFRDHSSERWEQAAGTDLNFSTAEVMAEAESTAAFFAFVEVVELPSKRVVASWVNGTKTK